MDVLKIGETIIPAEHVASIRYNPIFHRYELDTINGQRVCATREALEQQHRERLLAGLEGADLYRAKAELHRMDFMSAQYQIRSDALPAQHRFQVEAANAQQSLALQGIAQLQKTLQVKRMNQRPVFGEKHYPSEVYLIFENTRAHHSDFTREEIMDICETAWKEANA